MRLIDPAHSSQFMGRHNSGIATVKNAICAPTVFSKLLENQITTNFIDLTSSNFVAISHKLLRTSQFLEKIYGNSGMAHFAKINLPPPSNSMLQHIGRVAKPKLVPRTSLRYLQTTLIMGDE